MTVRNADYPLWPCKATSSRYRTNLQQSITSQPWLQNIKHQHGTYSNPYTACASTPQRCTRLLPPRPPSLRLRLRTPMPRACPLPAERYPSGAANRANRYLSHAADSADRTTGLRLAHATWRPSHFAARMARKFCQAL